MSEVSQSLGSFGLWVWGRCLQTLVTVCWLLTPKPWNLLDLLQALLLLYVNFLAHPVAYGSADDAGVRFRQYFREHFVPWAWVAGVEWSRWGAGMVKLRLKAGHSRTRVVYFVLNPPLREAVREYLGRSTPAVVVWMLSRIGTQAPQAK
jgi:hypothetical protein